MKQIEQTVFDDNLGDCLRACVASIFEFPIEDMPNFWEQTQDSLRFWKLVNDWLSENYGRKCIVIAVDEDNMFFISGLVCVAIGSTSRSSEQHAVVWCDGVLYDPHPSKIGITGEPSSYAVFVPVGVKSPP